MFMQLTQTQSTTFRFVLKPTPIQTCSSPAARMALQFAGTFDLAIRPLHSNVFDSFFILELCFVVFLLAEPIVCLP